MPPKFNFQDLINKPLGPYSDAEILTKSFPPPGVLPTLELLALECANKPIGFDDCEHILAPSEDSLVSRHPVFFFGVLKVDSLEWLSDDGKNLLEADLRNRDEVLHPHIKKSGLTLERLYGDVSGQGSTVSVFIRCEKTLAAEYMTSDRYKDSFLISSKTMHERNRNRLYKVLSLEKDTNAKSQNFIMRYRLWASINKLIEINEGKTPVQDRTVNWLVGRYIERRELDDPNFHLNLDWQDMDASDGDNDGDLEMRGENEGESLRRRRHPSHISQAEVKGYFASQCEWLLAQQLAPSHRLFWNVNMIKWVKFCTRVQTARTRALESGMRWGLPIGVTVARGESLATRLSQFGESVRFWEQKLRNLEINWPKVVKKQESQEASEEEDDGPAAATLPSAPTFQYDSDFSDASTPGEADSEEDLPTPPPELLARIPHYIWQPPAMWAYRFRWDCPGCDYTIDFLNLQQEHLALLPNDLAEYVASKKWESIVEDRIVQAFGVMARHHYLCHLHQVGAELVCRNGKQHIVPYDSAQMMDD